MDKEGQSQRVKIHLYKYTKIHIREWQYANFGQLRTCWTKTQVEISDQKILSGTNGKYQERERHKGEQANESKPLSVSD